MSEYIKKIAVTTEDAEGKKTTVKKDIYAPKAERADCDANGNDIAATYQPKEDTSLPTQSKTVTGAIDEIVSMQNTQAEQIQNLINADETHQTKEDASLTTDDQTIVGAINEHESDIADMSGKIDSILDGSSTVGKATDATRVNDLNIVRDRYGLPTKITHRIWDPDAQANVDAIPTVFQTTIMRRSPTDPVEIKANGDNSLYNDWKNAFPGRSFYIDVIISQHDDDEIIYSTTQTFTVSFPENYNYAYGEIGARVLDCRMPEICLHDRYSSGHITFFTLESTTSPPYALFATKTFWSTYYDCSIDDDVTVLVTCVREIIRDKTTSG